MKYNSIKTLVVLLFASNSALAAQTISATFSEWHIKGSSMYLLDLPNNHVYGSPGYLANFACSNVTVGPDCGSNSGSLVNASESKMTVNCISECGDNLLLSIHRRLVCPVGYTLNASLQKCFLKDYNPSLAGPNPGSCNGTNPIDDATGIKTQIEIDFSSEVNNGIQFQRVYSSLVARGLLEGFDGVLRGEELRGHLASMPNSANFHVPYIGYGWRSNFHRSLSLFERSGLRFVVLSDPDGRTIYFSENDGIWETTFPTINLMELTDNQGWKVVHSNGDVQYYSNSGWILEYQYKSGNIHKYQYIDGKLNSVRDDFGNVLSFSYSQDNQVDSIEFNNEIVAIYSIVDGFLDSVSYQGFTKLYHYEDPSFIYGLTGITDERGYRYNNWEYDGSFYGKSSSHGSNHLNDYVIEYPTPDQRIVTNPFGLKTTFNYIDIDGTYNLESIDGAATLNCAASAAYYSYDPNGFRDKTTDRNGNVTDYDYSASGLLDQKTEGLKWTDIATRTETVTTPETRVTEYDWIESTRQLEEIRAPGLTTHNDYWPNNRIKQVTLTDTTAHTTPLGSTANQQRVTTYDYTYFNGEGLPVDVLVESMTIDGPLAGPSDQTVYQYDQQGHLLSITNALGHSTHYSDFTGRGQPQTVIDANGVVTELSYHPRGWLESVTLKSPSGNSALDAITQYTWYPNGTLEQITLPDGSYLHCEYNDARHLIEISNNLGEKVEYEPNAMGDWTEARTLDSSAAMKRLQNRAFDELGRLMDLFGNNNQHTHYDYDTNDNLNGITQNGTSNSIVTTLNHDSLNRLKEVLKPVNTEQNNAPTLVNVDTLYGYDSADNLTNVTDPNGNTTTYVYNGFGEKITQISPDTGTTYYWYDAQGNMSHKQDARNITTQYHYDVLGRLEWVQYPTSAEDVRYYYDEVSAGNPYAEGQLTRITDQSGSTQYQYDHRGNVTTDTRVIDSQTYTTQYAYNLADNLTQIHYPSGRIVNYHRDDVLGRISSITMQADSGAAAQTVIDNIQYLPFGPITSYTYGNGLTRQVPYDLDYRVDQIQIAGSQPVMELDYGYDDFDNIQSIFNDLNSGFSQTFLYDDLHRLQHAYGNYQNGSTDHIRYEYDLVGNRTLKALGLAGADHTTESYYYQANSNQLESVTRFGATVQQRDLYYSDAGNLEEETTFDGHQRQYGYNDNNRYIELLDNTVPKADYRYNALGQRVSKVTETEAKHFHYGLNGSLLSESATTGQSEQDYIYLNGQLVAMIALGSTSNPNPTLDLSQTSAHSNQDNSSVGSVNSSENSVTLIGNRWRYIDGATVTITENTVVEFEFTSDGLGEIQGIGFDNDSTINNGEVIFNLIGSQNWGVQSYPYTGNGAVQQFSIPVGQYLTGDWQLLIVNDSDDNPNQSSVTVSNVRLCEYSCDNQPPTTGPDPIDLTFTSSYGGQDSNYGSVQSNETSIAIQGNRWRYVDGATVTITESTVVEFEFTSDGLGEIQGIGFDNDSTINNGEVIFNLIGSQNWGVQSYPYTGNGAMQQFSIPVGQHLTGEWQLLIVNDSDEAPSASSLTVSNVYICETTCGGSAQ